MGRAPRAAVTLLFNLLVWTAASFQANRNVVHRPFSSPLPFARRHQHHGGAPFVSKVSARTRLVVLYDTSLVLAGLDSLFRSAPYVTAALTCGIKASSADWVAQSRQFKCQRQRSINCSGVSDESTGHNSKSIATATITITKSPRIDLKRNMSFLLYGAVYQGMAQEFIYNRLYPTLFGAGTSLHVVLAKVAFDLLIQTTCVTLPIAYLTKAIIYKQTWRESWRRYVNDIWHHGLLTKYYLLWGPVQCITFGIIPPHFRVSFIACVSFFWLIILSSISSRNENESHVAATEADAATVAEPVVAVVESPINSKRRSPRLLLVQGA